MPITNPYDNTDVFNQQTVQPTSPKIPEPTGNVSVIDNPNVQPNVSVVNPPSTEYSPVTIVTPKAATDKVTEITTGLADIKNGMATQSQVKSASLAEKEVKDANTKKEADANALKQQELDIKNKAASDLSLAKEQQANAELLKQKGIDTSNSDFWSSNPDYKKNLEALKAGTYSKQETGQTGTNNQSGNEAPKELTADELKAQELEASKKKIEENEASVMSDLQSMLMGTHPLTTEEQAQIDSIKQAYGKMIEEQRLVNKNYEAGVTIMGIRSGRNRYAGEMEAGNIQSAVNEGLKKVQEIEAKMNKAVIDLTESIKDKDYDKMAKMYSLVNQQKKDKTDEINTLAKKVADEQVAAAKKAQDDIANQLKLADLDMKLADQELQSKKFTYTQKQDMISNILANDKQSWQQKQDLIKNQLDASKFNYDQSKDAKDYDLKLKQYSLDIQKAEAAATPDKVKEWSLAGGSTGTGKTLSEWLLSGSGKPATADQQKNAGYAIRMKEANDNIAFLTKQFTDKSLVGQQYQTLSPSLLQSEKMQMLENAERDFVSAILRKESGAAISASEFDSYKKLYFPQPGDKPQAIKQKEEARLNSLKGVIMSSGPAVSDEFKNSYNKYQYTTPQQYLDVNPDKAAMVKKIEDANTDLPDEEILQMIKAADPQSFSSVGGDTNKAVAMVVSQPDNAKGGQCGRFVNKLTGLGLGDSYQSKMAKMDPLITKPEPGMVFTMPYGSTGHVGFILDVNNGIATVKDSNYSLNEKIKTHQIPVAKMTGFKRIS